MKTKHSLYLGDCEKIMKMLPDNSIDLIFTSPPYSDQRKKTYVGIPPDKYINWFLPKSEQMLRILKPTGTFILNIKEKTIKGEKSTYVIELIMKIKQQGWLWTEEFIWHKKDPCPGKWPNRFKDAWERLLQFNKNKKFNMYQEAVMIPIKNSTKERLKRISKNDKKRHESKTGSRFVINYLNLVGRNMAYPSNVLFLATETKNKKHSAVFPEKLPTWFIKLFTKPGDTILDPFMGSGTTNVAAKKLCRNSIGIEKELKYLNIAKKRLNNTTLPLFTI